MSINFSLSVFFVSMYNNNRFSLGFLFEGDVPKLVMLSIYKILVNDESIPPIEALSEESKLKLVTECRETGLFFTNETLINSAKILHTIKYINENS